MSSIGLVSLAVPAACLLSRSSCVDARRGRARAQLDTLRTALTEYTFKENRCPETLEALYTRGYVAQRTLLDPWGQPIDYRCLRETRVDTTTLRSAGPDGVLGTGDDITAWAMIGRPD